MIFHENLVRRRAENMDLRTQCCRMDLVRIQFSPLLAFYLWWTHVDKGIFFFTTPFFVILSTALI
jgi:hypothetical protein